MTLDRKTYSLDFLENMREYENMLLANSMKLTINNADKEAAFNSINAFLFKKKVSSSLWTITKWINRLENDFIGDLKSIMIINPEYLETSNIFNKVYTAIKKETYI